MVLTIHDILDLVEKFVDCGGWKNSQMAENTLYKEEN